MPASRGPFSPGRITARASLTGASPPSRQPRRLEAAVEFPPLHQGVITIAVVATPQRHLLEAQTGIKGSGGLVAFGDFQGGPLRAGLLAQPQQGLQQLASQAPAPMFGMDRHRGDLQLLQHDPGAGHGEQAGVLAPAQNGSLGFGELPLPLLRAPQATEGEAIKSQTGGSVLGTQTDDPRGTVERRKRRCQGEDLPAGRA